MMLIPELRLEKPRDFALLLFEGLQDVGDGLYPVGIEDAGVTCHFPVLVGQAQGVA